MCEKRRVPRPVSEERAERPIRLNICRYCQDEGRYFAIPHFIDQTATDDIVAHIRKNHRPASGHPPIISFRNTDNADEIDRFMAEQRLKDEFVCLSPECGERCDDVASVAVHWVSEHVENPTPGELRRIVEAHPQRFCEKHSELIAEVFTRMEAEEARTNHAQCVPDDGYKIRHTPSVPRIRSRPGEFIVYVEGRLTRLPDDAVQDIIESGGCDVSEMIGGNWADGRQQQAKIELRYCNIVDGYIPLVREVCDILPPLKDGAIVEMSWQDDPKDYFPCKVSREKRAIYNLGGKLKTMFGLHSGARLYITRVGPLRYQLSVRKAPHWVRNCKIFESDGKGGWQIEFRDEWIEWETGDDVFRHQITFEKMEALHAEARRTNLSVRDAVHQVMERYAVTEPWHVRDVYEVVFAIRTCSLAAVWVQFRPEHERYVRIRPGLYRFDPNGAFPEVRVLTPRRTNEGVVVERVGGDRASAKRLRIIVHWSKIFGDWCPHQEFAGTNGGKNQARLIGSLISQFPHLAERLKVMPVSRAHPLSDSPKRDFVNQSTQEVFPHQPVPGTELFLFTNTSNEERREDILNLVERLGFEGSVEVIVTPGMSRTDWLNSLL